MHSTLTRIGMAVLLVAVGLLVAEMFLETRKPFEGTVALAGGERFDGWPGTYLTVNAEEGSEVDFPEIDFEASDVHPVFDDEMIPKSFEAVIQPYVDGAASGDPVTIGPDQPLTLEGTTITPIGIEIAPVFVLRVPDQGNPVKICVKLEIWGEDSPEDNFEIPHPAAKVFVRFFPHLDRESPDELRSASAGFVDPVFAIRVEKGKDTIEKVYTGVLRSGDELDLESIFLGVDEIRYWALFKVAKASPFNLLYAGGALAALGLLLSLIGLGTSKPEEAAS